MIIDNSSIDTYIAKGLIIFFYVASAFANGLALYLLLTKKTKNVADLLLIHFCFCEGLGTIWEIANISVALHHKSFSRSSVHFVGEAVIYGSVYQTLICITLDRFFAIKFNIRYRSIVTKSRFFVLLPPIWVLSTSLGVLSALTSIEVYYTMCSVFEVFTATILVLSYAYIIITVLKQKRIFQQNSSSHSQFKYEVPLCICLTYLILIFIPDLILTIKSDLYVLWFDVGYSINYFCDPLIYVVFSQYEKRQKKKNNPRNADNTGSRNNDREMTVISSNTMQSGKST